MKLGDNRSKVFTLLTSSHFKTLKVSVHLGLKFRYGKTETSCMRIGILLRNK